MGSFISSLFKNDSYSNSNDFSNRSTSIKEERINCEITSIQKYYCRSIIENKMSLIIGNKINFSHQKTLFNEFQLIYDHPFLLPGAKDKILLIQNSTNEEEVFIKSSGKMIFLDNFLTNEVNDGHKIVIICTIKQMCYSINKYLNYKNYKHCLLDSIVRGQRRQDMINDFKNGSIDIFVLCIEINIQGINLTNADTIIVFDSKLESENYDNAIKCCTKGNKKNSTIYRLITDQSYESEMLNYIKKKYEGKLSLLRENIDILIRYATYYSFKGEFENSLILPSSSNFWQDFIRKYQNKHKVQTNTTKSSNNNTIIQKNPVIKPSYSPKIIQSTQYQKKKLEVFNQRLSQSYKQQSSSSKLKYNKSLTDNAQKVQQSKTNIKKEQTLKEYLDSNERKIEKIIKEKRPLVKINIFEEEKDAENLPLNELLAYDVDGNIIELTFETDSYHTFQKDISYDERCFYNEIIDILFLPIEGYNHNFVTLALKTLYKNSAFIYFQKKFVKVVSKYISDKASLANIYSKRVYTDGLVDATPRYSVLLTKDEKMREKPPCNTEII